MDPHTTQKEGRSCKECHQDPRALGLGQGNLSFVSNRWSFKSSLSGPSTSLDIGQPLDAFVDIEGRPLVLTSRTGLRPFNSNELDKILYVGLCLPCHSDFDDPVMRNWIPGKAPSPCLYADFLAGKHAPQNSP
ncbi:MAG: hypothetical protein AVO38_05065 [delta proteobacterium ML8_D]|jgi:hypothetical protein|nr:MAG: hypothetical protein AVO38_05065 [delta proteobacterium ML8_D]